MVSLSLPIQYDTIVPNELQEDTTNELYPKISPTLEEEDDLIPTKISSGGVVLYTSPKHVETYIPKAEVVVVPSEEEQTVDKDKEVSWLRVIRLILKDKALVCVILLGVLGAAIQGAIFPAFAIFFGQVLRVFTNPFDQVIGLTHPWAGAFLALATVSGLANFVKVLIDQQITSLHILHKYLYCFLCGFIVYLHTYTGEVLL